MSVVRSGTVNSHFWNINCPVCVQAETFMKGKTVNQDTKVVNEMGFHEMRSQCGVLMALVFFSGIFALGGIACYLALRGEGIPPSSTSIVVFFAALGNILAGVFGYILLIAIGKSEIKRYINTIIVCVLFNVCINIISVLAVGGGWSRYPWLEDWVLLGSTILCSAVGLVAVPIASLKLAIYVESHSEALPPSSS